MVLAPKLKMKLIVKDNRYKSVHSPLKWRELDEFRPPPP